MDDIANWGVSPRVVLLPRGLKSSLGCNGVELYNAGLVDPTDTSEVRLIGVVGVTRM